ncbi:MAG: FtsW/RodA/SpoVE family cell cycle protein, partial [Chlorobium sp.]
ALPFISYGGTALIFNSLGVGILISISRYRKQQLEHESAPELSEGEGL